MEFNPKISPLNAIIGDAPVAWLVNFEVERFWKTKNPKNILGMSIASDLRNLVDPEQNVLCNSRPKDVVILREAPCPDQIAYLRSLGLAKATIFDLNGDTTTWSLSLAQLLLKNPEKMNELRAILVDKKVMHLTPFGATSYDEELAKMLGLELTFPKSKIVESVNSKLFSAKINYDAPYSMIPSKTAFSIAELETVCMHFLRDQQSVLIKDPMGVSGKGIKTITSEAELKSFLQYLKNRNLNDFELLVETLLPKKNDYNSQIIVKKDGTVVPITTKMAITKNGKHLGHVSGACLDQNTLETLHTAGQYIGKCLHEKGYFGIAGHDAIDTLDGKIFPNLEINARLNQSSLQWILDQGLTCNKLFWYGFIDINSQTNLTYKKIIEILKSKYLFTSLKPTGFIPINSASLNSNRPPAQHIRLYGAYFFDQFENLENDLQEIRNVINNGEKS